MTEKYDTSFEREILEICDTSFERDEIFASRNGRSVNGTMYNEITCALVNCNTHKPGQIEMERSFSQRLKIYTLPEVTKEIDSSTLKLNYESKSPQM